MAGMPRGCKACSSHKREEIDRALALGEPLRNIGKRVSISPAALLRHKRLHIGEAAAEEVVERRPEDELTGAAVNVGRHEYHCTVCLHPRRVEIEEEWVAWGNTSRIAKEYRLSRDSLYRHAHAMGLFAKRQRNIRKALERIIEQAETVDVNASAVVAAIQAYAKINNSGQWVEHVQGTNMNELFDRMTREELDAYARSGALPSWFSTAIGATGGDSQERQNEG